MHASSLARTRELTNRVLFSFLGAWASISGLYLLYSSNAVGLSSGVSSCLALTSGLVLYWILDPYLFQPAGPRADRSEPIGTGIKSGHGPLQWPMALGIVGMNGLLGLGAGLLVTGKIAFPEFVDGPDLKSLFLGSLFVNVLVTQVAGWALQSFLTFLVATLLDGRGSPQFYFQLVGVSYVGYLLLTIFLGVYNQIALPYGISVEELQLLTADHRTDVYAKIAEYLVLTLVAFGIFFRERFGLLKSALSAVLPSLLLLTLNLGFQWLIH